MQSKGGLFYDLDDRKRSEANERNEACAKLTVQERIAKLDAKLGVGQGAKKERERLMFPKLKATKAAQSVQENGINQPHSPSEKRGRAEQHARGASAITPAARAYHAAQAQDDNTPAKPRVVRKGGGYSK